MSQRSLAEMVRDQKPLMLPPDATVQDACRAMQQRRVGAVLIVDAKRRLVGIFTGRDAVCRVLAEACDPTTAKLADVMTKNPTTMASGKTAMDALLLMQDGGFRHLPVIERDRVIGIVSRADFRGLEQARLDEETGLAEKMW
jgi:CBS domain-containing protein